MKEKFTETNHCQSKVHCESCRTSAKFRKSIMENFEWDGECPYGVTEDNCHKQKEQKPKKRRRKSRRSASRNRHKKKDSGVGVKPHVANQFYGAVERAMVDAFGDVEIASYRARAHRVNCCLFGCEFLKDGICKKIGHVKHDIVRADGACPAGRWKQKGKYWMTPKLWHNETVFLLGGGPSLLAEDLTLIHDRRVLACNDAFKLGCWVDAVIFGDGRWYRRFKDEVNQFEGLKIAMHGDALGEQGWHVVRRIGSGIWTVPGTCGWNLNIGLGAVNLAINLGAARIVLLGYDMKFKKTEPTGKGFDESLRWEVHGKTSNWHHNPWKQRNGRHKVYIKQFDKMKGQIDKTGVEVINATPDSALRTFPYRPLRECLDE